jgi:hypothetical protein
MFHSWLHMFHVFWVLSQSNNSTVPDSHEGNDDKMMDVLICRYFFRVFVTIVLICLPPFSLSSLVHVTKGQRTFCYKFSKSTDQDPKVTRKKIHLENFKLSSFKYFSHGNFWMIKTCFQDMARMCVKRTMLNL